MSDQQTRVITPVNGTAPVASAESPTLSEQIAELQDLQRQQLALQQAKGSSRLRLPSTLNNPPAAVWAGLAVTALGFLLIFFSWIKVAATLDVGRQMPYVVSGAMLGLGVIIVGVGIVDMAVRRQDRQERRHQIGLLQQVLTELKDVLEPADTP